MSPNARLTTLLSFALLPLLSYATPITYSTVLSGTNEVPPNGSTASGTAVVSYDPLAHTLDVNVMFAGLTAAASASHIHAPGAPGVSAAVAVGFPSFPAATSGSYANTFNLTLPTVYTPAFLTASGGTAASAEASLATYLSTGVAYVNIHNSVYPGGEIRGNLTLSVPDAGSTAVLIAPMLLCLFGLGWMTKSARE